MLTLSHLTCICKMTEQPAGPVAELFIQADSNYRDLYIQCPFCNRFSYGEDGGGVIPCLMYEDYVEYPMIWCEWTGDRGVLDPASFKNAVDEFEKICDSYTGSSDIWNPSEQTRDTMHSTSFKIPLLFIERVADNYMTRNISECPLEPSEVKELADSEKRNNRYDPEIVKKLGLIKIEEDCETYRNKIMNISVPVNSYSVFNPSEPFPCKVSTAHDGVNVAVQVRELDGRSSVVFFWGD